MRGVLRMNVFAIGDLHLSMSVDKPMDIFGPAWENHVGRMEQAWREAVGEEDLVLLPGDISWGMTLAEAGADLDFIARLPGVKVMIRGNHDYWWNSPTKVRGRIEKNVHIIQNDCFSYRGLHIAGTRGWTCPGSTGFSGNDEKIYNRECIRLELSLKALPETGRRIAMLHYPPCNEYHAHSGFMALLEQFQVELLAYGHLHGKSCKGALQGVHGGVAYHLVSADHLGFAPKRIMRL